LQEQPNKPGVRARLRRLQPINFKKVLVAAVVGFGLSLGVLTVSMNGFADQQQASTVSVAGASSQLAKTVVTTAAPTTSSDKSANGPVIAHEVRKVSIPFATHMKMSHGVSPGNSIISQRGVAGVKECDYDVVYKNGNPDKYTLVSEHVLQQPVDEIILAGIRLRGAQTLPSRSGSYDRIREFDMVATGYSPHEGSKSGRAANGMHAGYGVVAVDPRVIPLGSRLYIAGYGYAIAGDTGGAIKGYRIDLGHSTFREAANVGRHTVHVYVLASSHE